MGDTDPVRVQPAPTPSFGPVGVSRSRKPETPPMVGVTGIGKTGGARTRATDPRTGSTFS